MNKKIVTETFIREWISSELKIQENLTEISLGGIRRLRNEHTDGCNWSKNIVLLSWEPKTVHKDEILLALSDLISRAAILFNLK